MMKTTRTDNQRALAAYTKLVRASDSVTSRTTRAMTDADLTISQFGVLEALLHKGPLCQRDLAAKILKSSGNLTLVIDNLEKRGLVRRERDNADRRFLTIHLTPAGNALIERVFARVAAAIAADLALLTPAEQDTLAALCKKLGRQLRS